MTFDKADIDMSPFDAAGYLDSPEAQAEYPAAAFEGADAATSGKHPPHLPCARQVAGPPAKNLIPTGTLDIFLQVVIFTSKFRLSPDQ